MKIFLFLDNLTLNKIAYVRPLLSLPEWGVAVFLPFSHFSLRTLSFYAHNALKEIL